MSVTRLDDDDLVVSLPPPGSSLALRSIGECLDFVMLLQPSADGLVALCDDHHHVLIVVETAFEHLERVPRLAGRLDAVTTAMVFTAHPGDADPVPEDGLCFDDLVGSFATEGVDLLDWLWIDDRTHRSLAARRAPI